MSVLLQPLIRLSGEYSLTDFCIHLTVSISQKFTTIWHQRNGLFLVCWN